MSVANGKPKHIAIIITRRRRIPLGCLLVSNVEQKNGKKARKKQKRTYYRRFIKVIQNGCLEVGGGGSNWFLAVGWPGNHSEKTDPELAPVLHTESEMAGGQRYGSHYKIEANWK